MTGSGGIGAALGALGGGAAAPAAAQLDLIAGADGDGPAPAPDSRRGPGRPAGSRNKRTQEWVDHILARYESPLVVLARLMSRPARDISREYACSMAEALAHQIDAAKALAPYLHQRQPIAVDIDSRGVVQLQIVAGAAAAVALGDVIETEIVDLAGAELQISSPGEGEGAPGAGAPA